MRKIEKEKSQRRNEVKKAGGIIAICFSCLLSSVSLTACKMGDTQVVVDSGLSGDEVFKIKGEACNLTQAKVILTNYQNIYASMYGVDLWQHDFGEDSLEKYVKDLTISRLAQIMAMDFLAEEKEITLTEEEKSKVKEAAKVYFESLNDKEKEYMQVKLDDIEKLYSRYGLANKLYTQLTEGVNDEVSDDEARIMEAVQIYVTDEEKANEIEAQLGGGADFVSLANTYNEAAELDIVFGRDDVPKEVEEVVFSLENDQVSGKITAENGYYFMKCVNHYDQEKTDANKSVILDKRRKEAFDDVYNEFLEGLSSEFNEELWEGVKVEVDKEITTDSFFEVYEKYCKW